MKVVTASEMQDIDRIAVQELGLSGEVLMGLAGKAVADHIRNECPWINNPAVFSGTGNNGGDGFVAAYFLAQYGLKPDIFLVGEESRISKTSRVYYDLCKKTGIRIIPAAAEGSVELDGFDCIVDAILGTGSIGAARGIAADLIRAINDSDAFVVSVDIPSGLGSDGAAPESEAVIADHTVAIGLPKVSLVTYPGKEYAGSITVADIGFPKTLTESDNLKSGLIDADYFTRNSIREIESEFCSGPDTHKGARGHMLIIGGFDGMEGAAILAASAAFETGVGLVTLLTTGTARFAVAGKIPELMTLSLPEDSAGVHKAIESVLESKKHDAVILGPGLGRTDFSMQVAESVIRTVPTYGVRRVLIDGDGLFHLAGYLKKGRLDPAVEWVITPHFLEASRIMGLSVDEIRNNRHRSAGMLSGQLSCTALLKGPGTIVSNGDCRFINTTGCPALATAGSGDVLSGIVGAFMLRRFSAFQAAACGAWVHGKAAELYCAEQKSNVLKSTDILPYIRVAQNHM